MAAEINPNRISGLASGLDTKSIIDKLVAAERKKVEPVESRKQEKQLELDSWKQVKTYVENVKSTAGIIAKKSLWEGKLVSSSNPEIVEAIATSGAKPGKHTLIVDKLALNHQIASQGFASKDEQIGKGTTYIAIGEDLEQKLAVDKSNNTLQGYVDSINGMDIGVNASIIKTGNKERPFQVVLTSQNTGRAGEINIRSEVTDEGVLPSFDPYYTQPGKWKGIDKPEQEERKASGTGASTASPKLVGNYIGEEPLGLTFTVVNTGIVGVTESLQMRWEDDQGRFGYLDLGSFAYTPGEPVEVVDGISMIINEGEIIVNDSFTASAKNQESELFWWKNEDQRASSIRQPTQWARQHTEGGPIITGKYDSDEDDSFTLTVAGGGQIGAADGLRIEYESELGVRGTVFVGKGYEPGTKLSLGKGLEISLKPGILQEGDSSTFDYQADSTADFWWLEESEQVEGGKVVELTNWISSEVDEDEQIQAPLAISDIKGIHVSTAEKAIVGKYTDFEPKVYTFEVLKSGSIGVTNGIEMRWEDDKGNSGVLDVGGDAYTAGDPIAFDAGLSLVLGAGSVFETDSFTFRTFTPVIQPPQDAEIRFGATDLGGGLVITNSTNSFEDVIDGVKLNLLATDEKPITINIRGDTETAMEGIREFVQKYNEMLLFFKEVTKYDQETDEAAALQGDRNLPRIQAETSRIFIDPIAGLDSDRNLLINLGLKLDSAGLIAMDEEKMYNALNDDLSKVANLFRSFGQIENSGITFLSSSEKTSISGSEGFEIDITGAASTGYYETPLIQGAVEINEENRRIQVTVNGRESEEIMLETGVVSVEQLAKDLQRSIKNDTRLGKMKIVVTSEAGKIRIRSNSTGSRSVVDLKSLNEGLELHPMTDGTSVEGKDVQGSIDGVAMEGSGRVLSGMEGTDYEGLKLYVTLSENQISEGIEGNMVITKGVATKVLEYIEGITKSETGALEIYTTNTKEQLDSFTKEVKTLEDRVATKREKLIEKFARMEGKMGQLKSQQSYMSQQLAKI
ncbi:MAG: flagellar filament capping protein FliD [Proteobacteria bacterium]|nr:flagellar filament capping protein FliD [Pseudomonadota bacterium]